MRKAANRIKLKKFGRHISTVRKTKGLSLRELSYCCDIDHSKIGKIEKGMINITVTTILELAKGLDLHPKKLFDMDFDS